MLSDRCIDCISRVSADEGVGGGMGVSSVYLQDTQNNFAIFRQIGVFLVEHFDTFSVSGCYATKNLGTSSPCFHPLGSANLALTMVFVALRLGKFPREPIAVKSVTYVTQQKKL